MAEKRKYIRYVTKDKLDKVAQSNVNHIRKYFNYKNMNLSDATKKSYESDFNQWLVYINEMYEKGQIDEEDILDTLESKRGLEDMVDLIEDYVAFCSTFLGNNERRIQRRMSSISSFFLYLLKKRKISTNPLDLLERPSVRAGEKPQVTQTFLTENQVKSIRRGLKKLGNLQLELYFELSFSTLARVNAINSIRMDQIDLKNKTVEKVVEKEGYVVDLYFSDNVSKLIKEWVVYREKNGIDSEFLFVTKYGQGWKQASKSTMQSVWCKKIGQLINVPVLKPHDLRHSASSLLFNKGMPLEDVQQLLHHMSPETTLKHYIKRDMEKLQNTKKKFEI